MAWKHKIRPDAPEGLAAAGGFRLSGHLRAVAHHSPQSVQRDEDLLHPVGLGDPLPGCVVREERRKVAGYAHHQPYTVAF